MQTLESRLSSLNTSMSSLEVDLATESVRNAKLDAELAEKEARVSELVSELAIKDAVISEQGAMLQRNLVDYAVQVRSACHRVCRCSGPPEISC